MQHYQEVEVERASKHEVTRRRNNNDGHLCFDQPPLLIMGAGAQSLEELAQQLVVSLRGDQNTSGTARRVLARIKNDTGTTSRREWPESRAKLKG